MTRAKVNGVKQSNTKHYLTDLLHHLNHRLKEKYMLTVLKLYGVC